MKLLNVNQAEYLTLLTKGEYDYLRGMVSPEAIKFNNMFLSEEEIINRCRLLWNIPDGVTVLYTSAKDRTDHRISRVEDGKLVSYYTPLTKIYRTSENFYFEAGYCAALNVILCYRERQ